MSKQGHSPGTLWSCLSSCRPPPGGTSQLGRLSCRWVHRPLSTQEIRRQQQRSWLGLPALSTDFQLLQELSILKATNHSHHFPDAPCGQEGFSGSS